MFKLLNYESSPRRSNVKSSPRATAKSLTVTDAQKSAQSPTTVRKSASGSLSIVVDPSLSLAARAELIWELLRDEAARDKQNVVEKFRSMDLDQNGFLDHNEFKVKEHSII